jgi:hypothetical protein
MKTPSNRWFSLALAVPAFVLLTGAKGEGCSNDVIVEPEPPVTECEAGFTAVTVCEDTPEPISSDSSSAGSGDVGAPADAGCYTECVPDAEVCPEGTIATEICGEYVSGCEYDGDEGCVEPPTAECWISCEPTCPEGTRAEWVCSEEPPISSEPDSASGSGDEPTSPPAPACVLECVPDLCPPGYSEVGVCEVSEGGGEPTCWSECIPDEECPPGCYAQGECSGSAGSGAPEEDCVTVCICEEPSEPPPDEPQAS